MKMWKKHLNMPKFRKLAGAGTALALAVLLAVSLSFGITGVRASAANSTTKSGKAAATSQIAADHSSASKDSITETGNTAESDNTVESGTAAESSNGDSTLADGTYEITGSLQSATNKDKASMGNAALKKPLQLIVKNGKGTLSMEFVTMTVTLGTVKFKGYLGAFSYLLYEKDTAPGSTEKTYPATVTAYYNVYDSYNDPDTGTDANVKGLKYPKKAQIPVTIGDDFIWVQVYVPVMESVTGGAGRQFARLCLDWDSVNKVSAETETAESTETKAAETKTASTAKVDRSKLKKQITAAKKLAAKTGTYTSQSLKALNKAIKAARTIYKKSDATAQEISAQVTALKTAQKALIKKSSQKLNKNNLANGTYTLNGTMVKTDKTTLSMANEAISHQILLTVKKGKYYLTVTFNSMKINGQDGYLGKLYYYKTGYKTDTYGNPKGSIAAVSVDAYQKKNGKKVSDSLGTDYPAKVTFPLISEGIKKGYVPLQVFVPVMDAISAGTGTQSVYLKLDWESLKKKSTGTGSLNETKVKSDTEKTVTSETSSESENETEAETKSVSDFKAMTSLPGADSAAESQETTESTLQNTLVNEIVDTDAESAAGTDLTNSGQTSSADSSAGTAAVYGTETSQNSQGTDYDALLEKMLPILISGFSVAMGIIYKIWSRNA